MMALHDYEAMDEDDFYGQGFRTDGVVSVWAGLVEADESENIDMLQDLCGVGYYNLDSQESNHHDFQLVPLQDLLSELSYSSSFMQQAIESARTLNINNARWVVVQYDFAYDPLRVKRPISDDPVFLGVFSYSTEG